MKHEVTLPTEILHRAVQIKQNVLNVTSPLIKNDDTNNLSIDLSNYALKDSLNVS